MDFIVDKFKFLGLNDREVKVFTALATFGRMNMTKIASRSQLPRTTVDAIVRRLLKQGLIAEEKVRGHVEYEMNPEDVADKLDWIEKRLRPQVEIVNSDENIVISNVCIEQDLQKRVQFEAPKQNGASCMNNTTRDILCRATKKCAVYVSPMEIVQKEMKAHEGERVKLMFSHNGDDRKECVSRLISYIGFAVERNIKLEILLSTTIADNLRDRESEVTLPSNANVIRLNVVPSSYGTVDSDMFIFRDSVLLVNPEAKTAELVQHATVVEMSKHLLGVACETGWSINLTAWLDEN